jgi:16S rRNA (adenine1518-N6/adenine1519-N6)-dimethyltransferase
MNRRTLGQNFLFDPVILDKIVAEAGIGPEDTVVEIGPGPGRLTRLLTQAAGRVIAIELDGRLYSRLCEDLAGSANLELVCGDALKYNYEDIGPFKVVANIPYYITTPIIFRLLEARSGLISMTLTIQKEVADRIVAGPGSKDYGALSLGVQYHASAGIRFIIPASAFRPAPKVDSAVIRMDILKTPPVSAADEDIFFRIIRAGFSQRRKTILNSLKPLFGDVKAPLLETGIDPVRRAETLTMEEFARLSYALRQGAEMNPGPLSEKV